MIIKIIIIPFAIIINYNYNEITVTTKIQL